MTPTFFLWHAVGGRSYTPVVTVLSLLLAAAAFAQEPGDAQIYFANGRLAAVYDSRVEFYRYGSVTPAVVRPDHAARPLLPGVSVRGTPAFLDSRGQVVELRPQVKTFVDGLFPPPEKAAASPGISICGTSPGSFCGVLGLDGEEKAVLRSKEEAGLMREPVGSKPDGTEALFALTRYRAEGKEREVVGYRLWRKKKRQAPREELLGADDPQVKVMLEAYEGGLVLPPPGSTLHFRDRDRTRRRR